MRLMLHLLGKYRMNNPKLSKLLYLQKFIFTILYPLILHNALLNSILAFEIIEIGCISKCGT
jgi:hypothetical protein